jgi:hypothetical protein
MSTLGRCCIVVLIVNVEAGTLTRVSLGITSPASSIYVQLRNDSSCSNLKSITHCAVIMIGEMYARLHVKSKKKSRDGMI